MTLYRSPQVCELTGASARQLVYWIDQGVITPTIGAGGSGRQHRWSATDIRTIRVIDELRGLGCDIATLRLVPEILEHHRGEGWLLAGPGRVRLCDAGELAQALLTDEPSWHVVRLTTVLHDLPVDDDAPAAV